MVPICTCAGCAWQVWRPNGTAKFAHQPSIRMSVSNWNWLAFMVEKWPDTNI